MCVPTYWLHIYTKEFSSSVTLTSVQKPTLTVTVTGSPRYIRMHFSVIYGLGFVCVNMMLFLPAQGQRRRATPRPSFLLPVPECCPKVSPARVPEAVIECFEQTENTIRNCKIHAFIFVGVSGEKYCVDPSACWLPERLERLAEKGINCTSLGKASNHHGTQIF